MNEHEIFMKRCLQLAANGLGHTRTNPMVGCVIVKNNKIIAEGFHTGFGWPHAEVMAISRLEENEQIQDATLYVNLEPCSHYGKTPPCTNLILEKGFKKVVFSSTDPNPLVNGRGADLLRENGVEIIEGVLDKENRELNKRFFTFHEKKRPYIILKWAQSNDGWIAPENHKGSYRLTGNESDILVHKWRSTEAGILVGRKTVENDNPFLTVRHIHANNPVRIILDPDLKLNSDLNVFNNHSTTMVINHSEDSHNQNVRRRKASAHEYLKDTMRILHDEGINSVLVEGGFETLKSFIADNLWDEARIFNCPVNLQKGINAPHINGKLVSKELIGKDELTILQHA